ncbi:MAG: type II and III secretion system protein [Veillonellaceae bacterium]|nr:type II and III secretion system protein [Veillonellaceae bacterium]
MTVLVAVSLLVGGIGPNRGSAAAMDAANVVNTPATPAETAAADVAGYRIVNGVAIYPILPGNETVVQGLLSSLAQDPDFQGISMTLYAPVGTKPKILLSNQSEERLRYAVQKLKTIMSRMGEPHRLVVAAYLREISISNDDAVGLSLFSNGIQGGLTSPNTTTVTTTSQPGSPTTTTRTNTGYTLGLANLPLNVAGSLTKSMSKGKVIVGSEITIVNGSTAELKNDDSMPVPLSGANNQVTFNTQTISSDVKITPTIMKFNAEKPEESIVRLDVVIQLSVPTDTVVFSNGGTTSSALEYTTQTLTSTHYVKANNEKIIGGLFASDTWTDSRSGIPILMNIPVLKYLFSTKTRSLQHMASILTIAVRILPVDKETGYDY